MNNIDLKQKSIQYRKQILTYIKKAKAGHTGGSLSCVDILNVLYNRVLNVSPDNFSHPNRDRYIQSKGHSVEALYVVLADCGFFPVSDLETLCQYNSHYVGHPTRKVNGIEFNTGALGHGLPISVGIALAGKKDGLDYNVFTLLGDGELAEGSNWEAALTASQYNLNNLTAIVDRNQLQITGITREVCNTEPLAQKFEAFGWDVSEVGGHDLQEMETCFTQQTSTKPRLIIANTVKGKGISFIEDNYVWHHKVPSDEEYENALHELDILDKHLSHSS